MNSVINFDVETVRNEFPLVSGRLESDSIVYLDNAATTQKPHSVLSALEEYYQRYNSNVHRGVHTLSDEATIAFEQARQTVADFINAESSSEIIWTRGTTEAINLVANCLPPDVIGPGDIILLSEMEHHSNIVPWQMLAERQAAEVKAVPVREDGTLDLEQFHSLLSERVKVFAITHVSNALGTINPIKRMLSAAHEVGAISVVDGAQAVAHQKVDVRDLNCDYYAFSSHKMYGPTGLGVLYGKSQRLDQMPPWQGGGEMIEKVAIHSTTYQKAPYKFEAGTPDISGAIATGKAVEFVIDMHEQGANEYESELLKYATSMLNQIDGVKIVGNAPEKGPIVSFLLDKGHPHDLGTLLNNQGVAVRTGHHCAMPLMDSLGIPGTVRASLALYNSRMDIDQLVKAVEKSSSMLA